MTTDTDVIAEVIAAAVEVATTSLRERLAALEAKAPVPGPPGERGERGEQGPPGIAGPHGDGGANGRDGVDGKDGQAGRDGTNGTDGHDGKDGPAGRDGNDGRDGLPGVPGRDGAPGERGERGEKGLDGKDGKDGTLDGASIEQVDERTFRVVRADGSALGLLKFAVPVYRGVYVAGQAYEKGDAVTYSGSLWIAHDATKATPGIGVGWQLAVKRGDKGKDGIPGKDGAPGPKGDRGDPGRNFS